MSSRLESFIYVLFWIVMATTKFIPPGLSVEKAEKLRVFVSGLSGLTFHLFLSFNLTCSFALIWVRLGEICGLGAERYSYAIYLVVSE